MEDTPKHICPQVRSEMQWGTEKNTRYNENTIVHYNHVYINVYYIYICIYRVAVQKELDPPVYLSEGRNGQTQKELP